MEAMGSFTKLPPRPEYIEKVKGALQKNSLPFNKVVTASALTRTQVVCALNALINSQNVVVENSNGQKFYSLKK